MSGRLLDEVKPLIKNKSALHSIQVFISHGVNDPVLGIHYARESLQYLHEMDIQPLYKEYPEGHTINQAMVHDLVNWLTQQKF